MALRGSADLQRDEMATAIESMPPTLPRLEALSYYMIKPQNCKLTSLCCIIKMQNCELSSLYYIVNSQICELPPLCYVVNSQICELPSLYYVVNSQSCELPSLYHVVNSQSCELPSLYHIVHSQFCALLFGRTYPLLQGGNRGGAPLALTPTGRPHRWKWSTFALYKTTLRQLITSILWVRY